MPARKNKVEQVKVGKKAARGWNIQGCPDKLDLFLPFLLNHTNGETSITFRLKEGSKIYGMAVLRDFLLNPIGMEEWGFMGNADIFKESGEPVALDIRVIGWFSYRPQKGLIEEFDPDLLPVRWRGLVLGNPKA
jgi:hypothetical protein